MRVFFTLAVLAFLPGCAGLHPAPEVITVEKAVFMPCVATKPQRPAFAVDGLPVGSGFEAQMKALRVERQQRIGYEAELESVVSACVEGGRDE